MVLSYEIPCYQLLDNEVHELYIGPWWQNCPLACFFSDMFFVEIKITFRLLDSVQFGILSKEFLLYIYLTNGRMF